MTENTKMDEMFNSRFRLNILERFDAMERHMQNLLHPIQQCTEILRNADKLDALVDLLSKPVLLDDRALRTLLNECKQTAENLQVATNSIDAARTYGEIKYIGSRLKSIEDEIVKIKKEGVKNKMQIEVRMNEQKMVISDETSSVPLTLDDKESQLKNILSTLEEREAKILVLRFGLDGDIPLTLEKISQKVHITKERVRQVIMKTLRKLRHKTRMDLVKIYNNPILNKAVFGDEGG